MDETRRCPRCRAELPKTGEHFETRKRANGSVWWGYCRPCLRELSREKYRRMRADPERAARDRQRRAANARRWRNRNRPAVAASHARWYETMRTDPERVAAYNARQRMGFRLRREQATGSLEVGHFPALYEPYKAAPNGSKAGQMLDAGPLVAWLRDRFPGWTMDEIAEVCGIDEAGVRRLLNGQYRRVSLHVADRAFVNAGAPHLLAILYPLREAAVA